MTGDERTALDVAIGVLRETAAAGDEPDAARERFDAAGAAVPGVPMDLVWQREAYDGSVHYDVLLHLADGATLSVAYCADRGLPWPMRGVHRWSEADLLRVGDRVLRVAEAMVLLDVIWDDVRLLDRLVDHCLVAAELERHPADVPDERVQGRVDTWRRAHGLLGAAETHAWLAAKGLGPADLEHFVREELAAEALRDRVAGAGAAAAERDTAFREWLDARRERTRVEWLWGPVPGSVG